ncbi:hypothetical protein L484_025487 [Morus notabilis]|uniref:Uncharacterized protein n=1 Tax=Morus notabilis TaxID=981085 RepID=W9SDA8_9ROSA|nr:hypothetical protein L484_025487 [Morus notabilis]
MVAFTLQTSQQVQTPQQVSQFFFVVIITLGLQLSFFQYFSPATTSIANPRDVADEAREPQPPTNLANPTSPPGISNLKRLDTQPRTHNCSSVIPGTNKARKSN